MAGCASGGLTSVAPPVACGPTQAQGALGDDVIKVLSLNLGHGRNQSSNQMLVTTRQTRLNLDNIAQTLDRVEADVVALQEADGPSRWSGNFDHVEYLRSQSQLACSLLGGHSDSWLATYGTALLARAELMDAVSVRFPATPPTNSKGFVMAEVQWETGGNRVPLTVVSVHLDFSRQSVRDEQVALLIDTLADVNTPLVVMGDMNSYWEAQRSQVRQLAVGLDLQAYEPTAAALGTYKSNAGKRLDWILISQDLAFADYQVLPDELSDHQAVLATLRLRAGEGL